MTELSNILLNLPSDTRIEGYIFDDPYTTISELQNKGYKFGINDPNLDKSTIQIIVDKDHKIFLPMIKLFAECLINGSDDMIKQNKNEIIIELFYVPSLFIECINYLLTNEIININDLDCKIDNIQKSHPKEFIRNLTNIFIENIYFPINYLHILIRNDFIESACIVFNYCVDHGISLPIGTFDTYEFPDNNFFHPYQTLIYDYEHCLLTSRKLVSMVVNDYYIYATGDYNKMYDEMIHGLAQKKYIVDQHDLIFDLVTIILDNHIEFDLEHFFYMYSSSIPDYIISNIVRFNSTYGASTVEYILSMDNYLDIFSQFCDKINHKKIMDTFIYECVQSAIILKYIDILYTYKYDFSFYENYVSYGIDPDILRYAIDRPDIKFIRHKSLRLYNIDTNILDLYHQLLLSRGLTFGEKFYKIAKGFIIFCCNNSHESEQIDKYVRDWKNACDNSIIDYDLLITELKKILLNHKEQITYHQKCDLCAETITILRNAINKYFDDVL